MHRIPCALVCTVLLTVLAASFVYPWSEERTIAVPADVATIEAAIERARDGDTVLVAPGTYYGKVQIDKAITLASHFVTTGKREFIDLTVIDGAGGKSAVKLVGDGAPAAVIGFTITNAEKGVRARRSSKLLHNRIHGNRDGIDYEGEHASLCAHNVLEKNTDDGIDIDHVVKAVIEHNIVRDNGGKWRTPASSGDGIEIRLEPYTGAQSHAVIRDNLITGNAGDGIQVIDFDAETGHVYRIEHNRITGNHQAGIGFMADGETVNDEVGYSVAERFLITSNVLSGNRHGMTGGGPRVLFVNNLVTANSGVGVRNPGGDMEVVHCLFWGNGEDLDGVVGVDLLREDPLVDETWLPSPGSPVLGAGLAHHRARDGMVYQLGVADGGAPDIGAFAPIGWSDGVR